MYDDRLGRKRRRRRGPAAARRRRAAAGRRRHPRWPRALDDRTGRQRRHVTALSGVAPIEPVAHRVWVADLALGAPATLIGGVLLWRRAALGYVTGAGLLFSFSVTPVELAAMLALQPQLTASPIDGATITGLLIFAAVSFAPLAFFLRGSGRDRPLRGERSSKSAATREPSRANNREARRPGPCVVHAPCRIASDYRNGIHHQVTAAGVVDLAANRSRGSTSSAGAIPSTLPLRPLAGT